MKILITGGHVTPALAVIEELQTNHKDIDIVFVGRKYIEAESVNLSWEYQEISKKGLNFIPLDAGRFTRVLSLRSVKHLLKIPSGFLQANKIINKEKPDIILSFGGYLALPVAVIGYFHKIPVFTHEQTIHPGVANKLISFFSQKTFISFEESKRFFNISKVILSGNPIRSSITRIIDKPFDINKTKPVIYVTGGSIGSHSINLYIKNLLPQILQKYIIIHQTGNIKEYSDFEDLQNTANKLPQECQQNYFIKKHISDSEIGYIYSVSDLVITRAGANTFFELIKLHKPSIFIPLPWSAHQEQQKHSQIFTENQVGEVFDQEEPSEKLLSIIDKIMSNIYSYQKNFDKLTIKNPENAAYVIIKTVLEKNK